MAAVISELKLYGNVNYTIGAREVPPIGSTLLPEAKITFQNVKCAESIFQIDLPVPYFSAMELTYLSTQAEVESQNQIIYGWITGIKQISGVRDGVRITWEIDHWRTYQAQITIRRGRLLRCPGGSDHESLSRGTGTNVCPAVYQDVIYTDSKQNHTQPEAGTFDYFTHNWALFCYVSSGQTSQFCWGCFPINSQIQTASDTPSLLWKLQYLYDGTVDEKLGMNPQSITGFWVIPFCPVERMTKRAFSDSDIVYVCDGTIASEPVTCSGSGSNVYVYAKIKDPAYLGVYGNIGFDLNFTGSTDEVSTIAVCNQSGSVAWALPYFPPAIPTSNEMHVQTHVDFQLQVSAVDCQIQVIFSARWVETGVTIYTPGEQIRLGLCCTIPAVSVPISSNAWSSYVYSGAREYDIESQRAQNEQAMYKGMAGAGNSAVFGALAGAAIGSAPGAIAGGIIGAVGQIVGSAVGGNVDEGLRQKIQELTDHYTSQQANGLLIPGSSNSWVQNSYYDGLRIVRLKSENMDWLNDQNKNGCRCDRVLSPLRIDHYGPWQIADAVIIGDRVPTVARLQIAKMLDNGVFIIERNGE